MLDKIDGKNPAGKPRLTILVYASAGNPGVLITRRVSQVDFPENKKNLRWWDPKTGHDDPLGEHFPRDHAS